jgi:hypothetical protein
MAQIKRKTRKKISKQLNKLVKRHGAERALALVGGIVSSEKEKEGQGARAGRQTRVEAPRQLTPRRRSPP